ncbi:hypothetical protein B0H34DRAFT_692022 [Crassisporium funariophilum]|nr:hypothetical protein B0H34DRAFT_692022 [Crassisporium funariophilum]
MSRQEWVTVHESVRILGRVREDVLITSRMDERSYETGIRSRLISAIGRGGETEELIISLASRAHHLPDDGDGETSQRRTPPKSSIPHIIKHTDVQIREFD